MNKNLDTIPIYNYQDSQIVIYPIRYNRSSGAGGAQNAPDTIWDKLYYQVEYYDLETKKELFLDKKWHYHKGISKKNKSIEKIVGIAGKQIESMLNIDKFIVTLGGDHAITNAPFRAFRKKYKKLSILHLDAHSDRRDSYDNGKLNHACVMARAQEMYDNIVSVGVRSIAKEELNKLIKDTIVYAHEIRSDNKWIDKTIKSLVNNNIYITIDLDVFDPSIIRDTGTPEPDGLNWQQITGLMRKLAKTKNIVGFDIVELSPDKHSQASEMIAAKLCYKILNYVFYK